MNAEIWRSEIITYGFIILNGMAVVTALVWAWRRGLLEGPEDLSLGSMAGGQPNSEDKVHE